MEVSSLTPQMIIAHMATKTPTSPKTKRRLFIKKPNKPTITTKPAPKRRGRPPKTRTQEEIQKNRFARVMLDVRKVHRIKVRTHKAQQRAIEEAQRKTRKIQRDKAKVEKTRIAEAHKNQIRIKRAAILKRMQDDAEVAHQKYLDKLKAVQEYKDKFADILTA